MRRLTRGQRLSPNHGCPDARKRLRPSAARPAIPGPGRPGCRNAINRGPRLYPERAIAPAPGPPRWAAFVSTGTACGAGARSTQTLWSRRR